MLTPRRTKFRKQHRGRRRGRASRGNRLAFGDVGLQAVTAGWVDSREIEAARRAISHHVSRGGQMWIRVFPDKPVTAKPAETRMGSGKGNVESWVAVVRPGRVLFEITGVDPDTAREAMRLAAHKMSVRTRTIVRDLEVVVG